MIRLDAMCIKTLPQSQSKSIIAKNKMVDRKKIVMSASGIQQLLLKMFKCLNLM